MRIDQGTEDCCAARAPVQLPVRGADKNLSPVFCHLSSERGVSMIELIMFIVIISVALAGILLVMNRVTGHSADTLVRKQALAVAESLLEEIELQDFIAVSANSPVTQANRATAYHIVSDYNGFATTGVYKFDSTSTLILSNYDVAVTVANSALGAIPAASALMITVTVTDPTNQTIDVTGYRTAY